MRRLWAIVNPCGDDFDRVVCRWALGFFMLGAGWLHLTALREGFQALVPSWMPGSKDFWVVSSGIVELGLGLAMITLGRWRRQVGVTLALFYVAVFPGNVGQWLEHTNAFALESDGARLGRLFLQIPLILAALYAAGLPDRSRKRTARQD